MLGLGKGRGGEGLQLCICISLGNSAFTGSHARVFSMLTCLVTISLHVFHHLVDIISISKGMLL